MKQATTFVGIDAHKKDLFVAMLSGRSAPPVTWQLANEPAAVRRLVRKLERDAPGPVHVFYEAGPCGYALQRQITTPRVACDVIAPALMPRKPGEQLLSGSFCVAGEGAYRADRVGAESFAQKTAAEARMYKYTASPLQEQIDRLIRILTALAVALSVSYIALYYLGGNFGPDELARMVAATITSMVPQGLVLMATLALLLGAVYMSTRGAIVNRLAAEVEEAAEASQGRGRVLIVDDSPDNRDLAAMVLESSGFQATTASNGLEGLIVAHYANPTVVLMDIAMPVLGGIESARLLKASAVTRHIPLLAYTATPFNADGWLARLFSAVLRKPVGPDDLVSAVRRFALGAEAAPGAS